MENTNKRIQLASFQILVFQGIFLVFLFILFFFFLFGKISEIRELKSQYSAVYEQYEKTKSEGLPFTSFKALATKDTDKYIAQMSLYFTAADYTSMIQSASGANFDEKILSIQDTIKTKKENEDFSVLNASVTKILPEYSDGSSIGIKKADIVSYLETLFHNFGIKASGDIKVAELLPYDSNISETSSPAGNDINSEKIFYFPLSFQIEGAKSDVFTFLHYLENVGKIEVSGSGALQIYSDSKGLNYNQQLLEITDLSLAEYPDSGVFGSKSSDALMDLVYGAQSDEKYSIQVGLRLYVLGLPQYSMIESISKMLERYAAIEQKTKMLIVRSNNLKKSANLDQIQAKNDIQNIQRILSSLGEEMGGYRQSLAKRENMELLYTQSLDLNGNFTVLEEKLSSLEKILTP